MIVVVLNRREDGWVCDIKEEDGSETHEFDLTVEEVIQKIRVVEYVLYPSQR